jgi:hypothetical protein
MTVVIGVDSSLIVFENVMSGAVIEVLMSSDYSLMENSIIIKSAALHSLVGIRANHILHVPWLTEMFHSAIVLRFVLAKIFILLVVL